MKELKTRDELMAILMAEIRTHPQYAHVTGVTIIGVPGEDWGAAWMTKGEPMVIADEIIRKMRSQFILK